MTSPALTERHMQIVQRVLADFPGIRDRIAVFGSRATGKARPNSDLDLVIRGEVDRLLLSDIRMAFEESLLPLKVDLLAYEQISNAKLREHIDRVGLPLPREPLPVSQS